MERVIFLFLIITATSLSYSQEQLVARCKAKVQHSENFRVVKESKTQFDLEIDRTYNFEDHTTFSFSYLPGSAGQEVLIKAYSQPLAGAERKKNKYIDLNSDNRSFSYTGVEIGSDIVTAPNTPSTGIRYPRDTRSPYVTNKVVGPSIKRLLDLSCSISVL